MAGRRGRGRKKNGTLEEIAGIGIIAGGLYLILLHVLATSGTVATVAGLVVAALLVGARLGPWADRAARRCGVRIVRARRRR